MRKEKIYYIYKTTNLINGKMYIGQRGSFYNPELDIEYLGSGKLFNRSLNKDGKNNFIKEILEVCSKESLDDREKYWIAFFNTFYNSEIGYNLTKGGGGGDTYSSIQGKERELLILKLKERKHRTPPIGLSKVFCFKENKEKVVKREEFYNSNFLIGSCSNGIYQTPAGYFSSAGIASKYTNLEASSLIRRCKNSLFYKVNRSHLIKDKSLSDKDIGKLFIELGYNFISRKEINLEFLRKIVIIKK